MKIFRENIYFFSTTGVPAYKILCGRTDNIDELSLNTDVFGLLGIENKEKEFLTGCINEEHETFLVASCAKGKRALLVYCPEGCPGMAIAFTGIRRDSVAALFGTGKYGKYEFSPTMKRIARKTAGAAQIDTDEIKYIDTFMSHLSLMTHTPPMCTEDIAGKIANCFESAGNFIGCSTRCHCAMPTIISGINILADEDTNIIFNRRFCAFAILCMCTLARNYSADRMINFSVDYDGRDISVDVCIESLEIEGVYDVLPYLCESAVRENMTFEYLFEGQTLKIHADPCYADVGLMGVKA